MAAWELSSGTRSSSSFPVVEEIQKAFEEKIGHPIHKATIYRFLKRNDINYHHFLIVQILQLLQQKQDYLIM